MNISNGSGFFSISYDEVMKLKQKYLSHLSDKELQKLYNEVGEYFINIPKFNKMMKNKTSLQFDNRDLNFWKYEIEEEINKRK